jgi:predicted phosphodiesterase
MNIITRRTFLKRSIAITAGASASLTAMHTLQAEPSASSTANRPDTNKIPDNPYADGKLLDGPPPLTTGAFTIAVLPDTQYYSERFPATYKAQTRWIVEQKEKRNIACVLHLGDLVDQNTPEQWEKAVKAMKILDGHIPYFIVPENHDYNNWGNCEDRSTLISSYFPVAKFKDLQTFGGVYDREPERMDNSFHLFSAGGRNFLVLCLEFGPRRDVVRWANEIVSQHRDREAILVTHAFTYSDNTRYDWAKFGEQQSWNPHDYGIARNSGDDVADGEQLWQELISRHESFIFTINGHVLNDGLGRLASQTPDGREIHQMLVNFQMRPKGGDGWLRLLEMCPQGTMNVLDFSPTRGQCNESPKNKFSVKLALLDAPVTPP